MKPALLFCSLILFWIPVCAQNWEDLNNKVIELYKTGDFKTAIPIAKKVVEIIKRDSGENHSLYGMALNNLAELYKNTGEYREAELLFITAKDIKKKTAGTDNSDYAIAIKNLASLYTVTKQNEKAEPLLVEYVNIIDQISGGNDPALIKSLDELALLYASMDKFEKAEPLLIRAKDLQKKIYGTGNINYITLIDNLAINCTRLNKLQNAEILYNEEILLLKKISGESNPAYLTALNDLVSTYEKMGQKSKSAPLLRQIIELQKKLSGENDPGYLASLNRLGFLYDEMGEYQKAELLYSRAVEIRKRLYGENNSDYAVALNNLAAIYKGQGQFKKAETLFLKSNEILFKILGGTDPNYLTGINNLALVYTEMGEYQKAEPLLIYVKEIRKKILGENDPAYAGSLNNLAGLYENMGLYGNVMPMYLQAMEIYKKNPGEDHIEYASILNSIALLYTNMGDYEKALPIFLETIRIQQKILGEEHPDYASTLNNLAVLYRGRKEYEKAAPLFIRSKEVRKKILGEEHPDYIASLNNLADLYEHIGEYQKAEELYIEALEKGKKVLGESHKDYLSTLSNLAGLYESEGQYQKAQPLILLTTKHTIQNYKKTAAVLSEREKENYLINSLSLVENHNSLLYNYGPTAALLINNFNLQLFIKSLSLSDTRNMLKTVRESKDSVTVRIYKEWLGNKTYLSKQYSLPAVNRNKKLDSLESMTESLEKKLVQLSSAFRDNKTGINITVADIQKNLQPGEAAVEFVRFRLFHKKWTDSIIYAAYILMKNDSVPRFIPLCEEKQLLNLFSSAGKTTTALVNNLYRGAGELQENLSVSKGDSLYKLIWQPMDGYLKGIKKVFYAPAGKLYTIAFNALPIGDGKLLMDTYELQQYSSIRQIALHSQQSIPKPRSVALFGDPDFSMDSLQLVHQVKAVKDEINNPLPAVRGKTNYLWSSLPGTAKEIEKINQLFTNNKVDTKVFTKLTASEENLKSLGNNPPQVLHIATHGFFLAESVFNDSGINNLITNSFANDPLFRSGIILAGGNYTWSGKSPISGIEDGIATAYEISQLDLSKTELVVLSACETALGDVKGSEGVFGLQRAFKLAGANKLIVSLWQVPDIETSELMTTFYTNWLSGKNIEESFYKAQIEMRKKYSPFYWAAFVLIE